MVIIKKNGFTSQRGALGLMAVLFISVLILIPSAFKLLSVSQKSTRQQMNYTVQADNVARAGLTQAILWFRRQETQPVRSNADPAKYPWADAAFYPRESTDTLKNDTLDESIGLVNEFALSDSGKTWGRFEVKRQPDTSLKSYDSEAVHDITDKRVEGGTAGEGLVWSIESRGYVYTKRSDDVAFDAEPNEVIGRARVYSEIRRIGLTLPANAAVLVNDRSQVTIQTNGRVVGSGDIGVGYYTGSSGPSKSGSGSELSGSPSKQDIDGGGAHGSLSPLDIFGVTESELKLMPDTLVSSPSEIGVDYPSMSIVFIDGHATFNGTYQLRGGGILYVDGNLTLQSTSNTLFTGMIYVTGNVVINGPALISGVMAVEGSFRINGSGDVAQVEYDGNILNSVRQQTTQYRENKAMFHAFSAGK